MSGYRRYSALPDRSISGTSLFPRYSFLNAAALGSFIKSLSRIFPYCLHYVGYHTDTTEQVA
jgi:hypothetical protein